MGNTHGQTGLGGCAGTERETPRTLLVRCVGTACRRQASESARASPVATSHNAHGCRLPLVPVPLAHCLQDKPAVL